MANPLCHDGTSVSVQLGGRGYRIEIGHGVLRSATQLLNDHVRARAYAVVADESVASVAQTLARTMRAAGLLLGEPHLVASGEASKSFSGLEAVCDALLDLGIERNDAVIAVGGGVVGDLAGFAAAIVKRGVRLVQVPTTLLAQVDSSVGGKTGINSRHGKNLIGAFYQPSLVLADLDTLATLPARDFRSGYAEVVKYGVLGDIAFFSWLEENRPRVFDRDGQALAYAVKVSCAAKAGIVTRDEREAGERALLNLGHTFGHAVEAWGGYSGAILHGEAVALGMVLAAEFSHALELCGAEVARRLRVHLADSGFAVSFAELQRQVGCKPSSAELLTFMEQDKKVEKGELTFILLHAIGSAFVARDIPKDKVSVFLAARLSS